MRTDKSIKTKHRNLCKPPNEVVTKVKSKQWDKNYDRISWKNKSRGEK